MLVGFTCYATAIDFMLHNSNYFLRFMLRTHSANPPELVTDSSNPLWSQQGKDLGRIPPQFRESISIQHLHVGRVMGPGCCSRCQVCDGFHDSGALASAWRCAKYLNCFSLCFSKLPLRLVLFLPWFHRRVPTAWRVSPVPPHTAS